MVVAPWILWAMAALMVVSAAYSYYAIRKSQKKNQQTANQLDGTIADEGVSFSDVAGSPHMYGNVTHIYGHATSAIKSKGGK
jgi:cbb3-type cytochrome oxidase subunit 3